MCCHDDAAYRRSSPGSLASFPASRRATFSLFYPLGRRGTKPIGVTV